MRVKEYYEKCNEQNITPKILPIFVDEKLSFIDENFRDMFEERFYNLFENYQIRNTLISSDIEVSSNRIVEYVQNLIFSCQYEIYGLYHSTTFEYNPIENYSMTETRKIKSNDKTNSNYGSFTLDEKNKVNVMDTAEAVDHDSSLTIQSERADSATSEGNVDETLTRSGNIGVTTSQQMIESERKLVMFSIIDYLCTKIKRELLILVDDFSVDGLVEGWW